MATEEMENNLMNSRDFFSFLFFCKSSDRMMEKAPKIVVPRLQQGTVICGRREWWQCLVGMTMERESGAKEAELRDWKVLRDDMIHCLMFPAEISHFQSPAKPVF